MVWLYRSRCFSQFPSASRPQMKDVPCKLEVEIIIWKCNKKWWLSYCLFLPACNRTCQTCSSSAACLTCRNGLILSHNGHCVAPGYCFHTEYYDQKTQTCKLCHKKCFRCSGPTEHQCLGCANNRYLLSKCLDPPSRLHSTWRTWNNQVSITFMKYVGQLQTHFKVDLTSRWLVHWQLLFAGLPGNSLRDWEKLSFWYLPLTGAKGSLRSSKAHGSTKLFFFLFTPYLLSLLLPRMELKSLEEQIYNFFFFFCKLTMFMLACLIPADTWWAKK